MIQWLSGKVHSVADKITELHALLDPTPGLAGLVQELSLREPEQGMHVHAGFPYLLAWITLLHEFAASNEEGFVGYGPDSSFAAAARVRMDQLLRRYHLNYKSVSKMRNTANQGVMDLDVSVRRMAYFECVSLIASTGKRLSEKEEREKLAQIFEQTRLGRPVPPSHRVKQVKRQVPGTKINKPEMPESNPSDKQSHADFLTAIGIQIQHVAPSTEFSMLNETPSATNAATPTVVHDFNAPDAPIVDPITVPAVQSEPPMVLPMEIVHAVGNTLMVRSGKPPSPPSVMGYSSLYLAGTRAIRDLEIRNSGSRSPNGTNSSADFVNSNPTGSERFSPFSSDPANAPVSAESGVSDIQPLDVDVDVPVLKSRLYYSKEHAIEALEGFDLKDARTELKKV